MREGNMSSTTGICGQGVAAAAAAAGCSKLAGQKASSSGRNGSQTLVPVVGLVNRAFDSHAVRIRQWRPQKRSNAVAKGSRGQAAAALKALTVNEDNFDEEVLKSPIPVLVEYWATWCGPCKLMGTFMDWAAQEYEGKMKCVKIEIDPNERLKEKYKVYGLPTIMLFVDGKEVPGSRRGGATNKEKLATPLLQILDDVNPVGLGRKARQLYDDVWKRLTELGQLTGSYDEDYEEVLIGGPMCDFTTPNAELTTVLVAGATGRVGRILIRKLQLRGYKVKALVRNADPETLELLPRSVQIVVGDLGDPESLKTAVEGCNKIICCATARSDITGDLLRVDHKGVYNLSKAFQDYNHKLAQTRAGRSSKSKLLIAKFSQSSSLDGWELREGTYFTDDVTVKYDGGMDAQLEVAEDGNAIFSGYVFTRGGYVELVKKIDLPPGLTLDRYEGLLLSVCGDGKSYTLLLETSDARRQYFARISTRLGYSRIRIPFSTFRPMKPDDPPLDPFLVQSLAIRFEPRRQKAAVRPDGQDPRDQTSFRLVLDYIKALPGGLETDFILVSCAGGGVDPSKREKLVRAKQAGEAALRNSGLGYTIVRPGPLQEEPGGQRALVFDQGDRISQGISCADVADVCVKALHNPTARNKSFDVCYEYTIEEGQGLYELVAHLPDKSNSYLTPALTVLEKNT